MFARTLQWSIMLLLFSVGVTTVIAGNCSLATLKGSIGFTEQGTVLPAPSVTLPYASTGIVTFDGDGHLKGRVTSRIGGTVHEDTFTGTYAVDADCTFKADITGAAGDVHHQVGTITGEGIFLEGRYIYTDPGLVATGIAKMTTSQK